MAVRNKKALRWNLRNALQPRDIRQVDPAFSAKPALWVRTGAIVVSLEGVRAIIFHDKMYVFDPESEPVEKAGKIIRERIGFKGGAESVDFFMPFEFKALEGILIHAITALEREYVLFEPDLQRSLNHFPTKLTTVLLEELRENKQRLNHFRSRLHNVQKALMDLLDDDEDMSNMYLTELVRATGEKKRDPMDHEDVEMLIEAYMQMVDDLVTKADLLDTAVDDTEDLVMIHLDTLRNKLLMLDLATSVFAMALAMGTVLAGIFGMNLEIPAFESGTSHWFFGGVSIAILMLVFGVTIVALAYLQRVDLFQWRL